MFKVGKKFQWSEGVNPCVRCSRDMCRPKDYPKEGKVRYHAKGYCNACYLKVRLGKTPRVYIEYDGDGQSCTKCGEHQPYSNFSPHSRTRSGYGSWCLTCHVLYKHGITKPLYAQMLKKQGGVCAICGKTPNANGKALAVDHDHSCCPSSGSCGSCIRGLLCDECNKGIGCFADSAVLLKSAQNYLEKN